MNIPVRTAALVALAAAATVLAGCGDDASSTKATGGTVALVTVPAADVVEPAPTATAEVAVLAGGCFWGVEGLFEHVTGVTDAVSGYSGGSASDANYASVSAGSTEHAESVRITFDPQVISYAEILRIYFAVAHDPTELDKQGPDTGTQYRSTIFPTSPAQEKVARAYIAQLDEADTFGEPVVTTVETGRKFYPAEEVHQDFMALYPDNEYIATFDAPKLAALKKDFPQVYKS